MWEDYQGMWSLFLKKKKKSENKFKGSVYEEKFKDRAKSREILENKGSCWGRGIGGGVGAWYGAQRKKLIHNSSISRKRNLLSITGCKLCIKYGEVGLRQNKRPSPRLSACKKLK